MKYYCLRCGLDFKQKNHFLGHLNRKNICTPILEPISMEEVKKRYGFENIKEDVTPKGSEWLQNDFEMAPKCSIWLQNRKNVAPKGSIWLQNQKNLNYVVKINVNIV